MTDINAFSNQLLYTMSKGNPGALSLLMRVATEYEEIILPCFCFDLENRKLLGSEIWKLYKDVHHEDFDAFFDDVWTGASNSVKLRTGIDP